MPTFPPLERVGIFNTPLFYFTTFRDVTNEKLPLFQFRIAVGLLASWRIEKD
jgi:hypothetical protein